MNRAQVLTIAVIFGFVVLGLVGVAVLALFPYQEVFGPTPTITPTSTVTPTPTFPVLLPTARLVTPTPEPPTPTSTRLPTFTPRPTKTPMPPEAVIGPTIIVPTSTPTVGLTDTPEPSPTPPPRYYTISFEADKTVINRGSCTRLRWQATGPVTIWVEDEAVEASGSLRVCPRDDTTYTLSFAIAGSAQRQNKFVRIDVN